MIVSVRDRAGAAAKPAVFAALFLAASCATGESAPPAKDFARPLPEGAPALVRIDPGEWPDLRSTFTDRQGALAALEQSVEYFKKPSSRKWFPYATADRRITHADQVRTLELLKKAIERSGSPDEFQGYCRLYFDMYKSVGWDGSGEVLFTSYYEPIFEGRLQPEGQFRHPLYRLPPDLVKDEDGTPLGRRLADGSLGPNPTRREIGARNPYSGLELVYLRDPFEAYIAHIQGSARIDLPGGRQMCVGYAGKTEHPYDSVGLKLVEEGKILASDLSLATLKQYFRDNPGDLDRALAVNPSYVFFLEREPGPFGSLGGRVTPYHTLATDKSVFPRGGPCVVLCRLPVAAPGSASIQWRNATCLVFDQDTGGAIRSAGRADLFVGTGPEAERLAGTTREVGRLYYLFAKPAPSAAVD